MSKRPADSPLEETEVAGSPRQKKARIGNVIVGGMRPPATVEDGAESGEEAEGEEAAGSEGEEEEVETVQKYTEPPEGYSDLYLDTVNRSVLDFDFEKLCSVSLSNINVYACLVCGKYFTGRGRSSHAYFHSVDVDHHVYINIQTLKVYVLPEGYEVKNETLDDIKYVVNPTYTKQDVQKLDKRIFEDKWDLAGKKYTPGFVGLNNIKQNDYLNVVVHALSHVAPLRNFLLLTQLPPSAPEILQRFSILIRKIWNTRAFKSHVSPHELLQEVSRRSDKRFTLTKQSDPLDFLQWFLNSLHLALGGSKTKPQSSIIQKIFQGKLRIQSQPIEENSHGDRLRFEPSQQIQTTETPFMMLALDLPPPPLFTDPLENRATTIPQVSLTSLLNKYNGQQTHELRGHRNRYSILGKPPPYLVMRIKRFTQNKFVSEKNPTIVRFETDSLDMAPYLDPRPDEPVYYDLVANIVHESVTGKRAPNAKGSGAAGTSAATVGTAGTGAVAGEEEERHVWKVQLRKGGTEWVEIQDLFVQSVAGEILFLGETCAQVWERRRESKKH
ncbi:cysteine proteinase [Ascobolus immersus RN42]|uniref:Cysteine proteinase n=1 Tax=Ascobolus immersus RN42 TaxID=1160509 RepID=A0A3N4IAF5_ASCIM|nr:cysteine proteinase [Ascobolus immersus RN42]